MADCVFCGQKAAFGKTITVGTMVFKACADCYDRYSGQDEKIIVDAVKAARIFNDDVKLREWYDNRISDLKKDAELLRSEIDDYERELKEKTVGICPKCGGPMRKMVAKKGSNAGNPFWSCQAYPNCNGTRKWEWK